jgi:hypothetical protein
MTVSLEGRSALLTTTLGYLQLRQPAPEVAMVHRCLDS